MDVPDASRSRSRWPGELSDLRDGARAEDRLGVAGNEPRAHGHVAPVLGVAGAHDSHRSRSRWGAWPRADGCTGWCRRASAPGSSSCSRRPSASGRRGRSTCARFAPSRRCNLNMFTLISLGVVVAYRAERGRGRGARTCFPRRSGITRARSASTSRRPPSSSRSCCSARCSSFARGAARAPRFGSC